MESTREWEDIVRDFLEVKCALQEPEQEYLVTFLRDKGIQDEGIRIYPAFSIADCLVVVVDGMKTRKRWFYHPKKKLIEG